jgi:hypothetical protein
MRWHDGQTLGRQNPGEPQSFDLDLIVGGRPANLIEANGPVAAQGRIHGSS